MIACFSLASCASLRNAGDSSVAAVKGSASAAMSKMSDLPLVYRLPGQGPKVVEVREKDLQEMPSGQELAQSHLKRRTSFWVFDGPVDFQEPSLPEPGANLDGSLLPPRMP